MTIHEDDSQTIKTVTQHEDSCMMTLAIKAHLRREDFCLNVDLELPAEGVTALFGRSGCGKTTLLRILAGIEKVNDAQVRFKQQEWQSSHFLPLHKRRLGLVFQESSLLPHLSVQGNLLYGYQRTRPELRRFQLTQVSEMLGIDGLLARHVETLSGGQRQRVALGRALLSSPQLLLLDEPLAALDSQSKAEIMPYLSRLANEADIPIILISHTALEVEKLADRIVFMQDGQVSSVETLEEATTRADSPLFQDTGPAVILRGETGTADAFGRIPFGPEHARFWLSKSTVDSSGRPLRLRIAARDVSVSTGAIAPISIQNQLQTHIQKISPYRDQFLLTLQLADGQLLLAEITRHACQSLGLQTNMPVTALVKSVALLDQ
jgi:molybdate transport system ATP-binding protein